MELMFLGNPDADSLSHPLQVPVDGLPCHGEEVFLRPDGQPCLQEELEELGAEGRKDGNCPYGVVLLLFRVNVEVAEGAIVQMEVDWTDSVLDLEAGIVPVNCLPHPHTRLQKYLEKEAVPLHDHGATGG